MHATIGRAVPASLVVPVVVVVLAVVGLVAPGRASAQPALPPGPGVDPVGVWPLHPVPEVVRGFEPPGSAWGAGHRGVDLLGHPGEPVDTSLDGVVSFTGVIAGRGVVVVDHGTTRTTYEPVDATVGVGTHLRAGGRLGTLELAGSHCPPRACLHWGWLRGTTYLDPLGLVGAGPVRLLPLWRDAPVAAVAPAASDRTTGPVAVLPYAGWEPLFRLFR